MPDCYGLTVAACESAITAVRPDATFTVATAASDDPDVADGYVSSTIPVAGIDPAPKAPTVDKEPDNGQDPVCSWVINNPHTSSDPAGAVDVKGRATCNYTTTITGSLTLWKCDDEPSANLASLENGDWGCVAVAEDPVPVRNAIAGVQVTYQAPPAGGDYISADDKWFIGYGTLDKGTPTTAFSNIVQLSYP